MFTAPYSHTSAGGHVWSPCQCLHARGGSRGVPPCFQARSAVQLYCAVGDDYRLSAKQHPLCA